MKKSFGGIEGAEITSQAIIRHRALLMAVYTYYFMMAENKDLSINVPTAAAEKTPCSVIANVLLKGIVATVRKMFALAPSTWVPTTLAPPQGVRVVLPTASTPTPVPASWYLKSDMGDVPLFWSESTR